MLSFDLSAIDVVLLVAVMMLFMLFVAQRRGQVVNKPQLSVEDQTEFQTEPRETVKSVAEESESPQGQSLGEFRKCVHHFGYLKSLPKGNSLPDECFGCPKVMRCLFPIE